MATTGHLAGAEPVPSLAVAPLPAALRRHGSASGTRQAVGPGERPTRRAPALYGRRVSSGRWSAVAPGAGGVAQGPTATRARSPAWVPEPKPAPATPAPKTAELLRSGGGAWAARKAGSLTLAAPSAPSARQRRGWGPSGGAVVRRAGRGARATGGGSVQRVRAGPCLAGSPGRLLAPLAPPPVALRPAPENQRQP